MTTYPIEACRDLRVGEEIRGDDLIQEMFVGLVRVDSIRPGMVGHRVLGVLNGIGAPADNVFRLRAKAPTGYSVKDWQTDFHAYHGGTCIAQCSTRKEAVAACWKHHAAE